MVNSREGVVPKPLTEEELKKLVSDAINAKHPTRPETFHARFDHLERGLQIDDVIHGLERNWKFERTPEFSRKHWQWKYYIETETVDGNPLTIVIAVDTMERSFEVITRWR